jgi:DNA-binding IclR family transcriptional regulator
VGGGEHEFSTFNSNAHLSAKGLLKLVGQARERNFSGMGHLDQGLTGGAVPLRNRYGQYKAALSQLMALNGA